jgi:uncharacterized membrane protein (GlpM family)
MQLLIKAVISACIIALCVYIGKKLPSLSGLIAVMPLTGFLAMLWLYTERHGDKQTMVNYCSGAVWGILPSILFFITALICFRKGLPFWLVTVLSFAVWIAGAFFHQLILGPYLSQSK